MKRDIHLRLPVLPPAGGFSFFSLFSFPAERCISSCSSTDFLYMSTLSISRFMFPFSSIQVVRNTGMDDLIPAFEMVLVCISGHLLNLPQKLES